MDDIYDHGTGFNGQRNGYQKKAKPQKAMDDEERRKMEARRKIEEIHENRAYAENDFIC